MSVYIHVVDTFPYTFHKSRLVCFFCAPHIYIYIYVMGYSTHACAYFNNVVKAQWAKCLSINIVHICGSFYFDCEPTKHCFLRKNKIAEKSFNNQCLSTNRIKNMVSLYVVVQDVIIRNQHSWISTHTSNMFLCLHKLFITSSLIFDNIFVWKIRLYMFASQRILPLWRKSSLDPSPST
jgi:hypothetical protein